MKKIYSLLLLSLFCTAGLKAEEKSQTKDQEKSLVLANALSFLDKPYVANTLESNEGEFLMINCDQVDCTTFVEYALAMALCEGQGPDMSETEFANNLQNIRYRNGKIDGYTSRLHYMSDWINNGVKNGIIEDVTAANSPYTQQLSLSYMTRNANKYPNLNGLPDNIARIKEVEQSLSGSTVNWIPKDKVLHGGLSYIKNGDIILITSSTPGLDIAHMGVAMYVGDSLCLLHASSYKGKVMVEPLTLKAYLAQNERFSGIRVVRMKK